MGLDGFGLIPKDKDLRTGNLWTTLLFTNNIQTHTHKDVVLVTVRIKV